MKNVLFVLLICVVFPTYSKAQLFIEKGDLKVGIKVLKDDKELSIDSLCTGYDPMTNMPLNFMIPEKSSVSLITDSIKSEDIALIINNRKPKYITLPSKNSKGFSMSSSPGSTNSYTFIDEVINDTLIIQWTVDYEKVTLLDLYPSNYFSEYVAFTFQNIFEEYPDSVRFDWSELDFINEVDDRGIPIEPEFPHNQNGLLFVVHTTEDAQIQLKGFHDKFYPVNIDNTFDYLLYENLPPGQYEYTVKPYEDAPEKLWLKYPFTIKKPWWRTDFVRIGIALLIGSLIGLIYSLYSKRKQKRQREALQLKQKITEAELKAIRAQLNPHFLFNALNSIQNLIVQKKSDEANSYIAKLSRLLRQVLSSSERQFQELEDELNLTKLYLELEQLRFPFTLKLEIADDVNQNILVPTMLFQPYVENAVKHGVAGNPNGEITFEITQLKNQLKIKIIDNGPGLSQPNANSKGLDLSKNRIDYLNDLYLNTASVEIENRNKETGVIVTITLPIE